MSHHQFNPEHLTLTRREFLSRCGMGMGALGLGALLRDALVPAAYGSTYVNPLAPHGSQFPGTAKRVIHLFMNGGPSHVDTFDPKPALEKYAGKMLPFENPKTERKTGAAFASPYKFQKYGQRGIEVSELFAHTAKCIDDICLITSAHADVPNHQPALLVMNCGEPRLVRPTTGSWVTYGRETENPTLPDFIAMWPG